jgi:cation transport ATPase
MRRLVAWTSFAVISLVTLIGLGVFVAYAYSVVAALLPGIFPASFRDEAGEVAVYFEAAGVIVTLILLGQVLELRARSQTSAAIHTLLGLAPKTAEGFEEITGKAIVAPASPLDGAGGNEAGCVRPAAAAADRL